MKEVYDVIQSRITTAKTRREASAFLERAIKSSNRTVVLDGRNIIGWMNAEELETFLSLLKAMAERIGNQAAADEQRLDAVKRLLLD